MFNRRRSHAVRQQPARCLCLVLLLLSLSACQFGLPTTAPIVTPTPGAPTPTSSPTPTLPPEAEELYRTYAYGELLPDMRVPIQRSESGEGGWYFLIGTEEGWAQFLSQMGQPAEIWEPISWNQEIVIGALLGVRRGRGHAIAIREVGIDGISVRVAISTTAPEPAPASTWVSFPFHIVRLPRDELPLGSVTVRFVAAEVDGPAPAGQTLASQSIDLTDLNILWLPGEAAVYPTPTPPPSTSTPEPTLTPTPVPNLQMVGTVLEVLPQALQLSLLPDRGPLQVVELMQATSILSPEGQSATVAQLLPGMTINVLGYVGEGGKTRAAHIDILQQPAGQPGFAVYRARDASLSTLYDGYALPLSAETISTTIPLTQTLTLSQTRVLTQTGFVVVSDTYPSFAALYSDPQFATYPLFVSADTVLHTAQLALGRTFYATERDHLLPELEMLDRRMFELSWSQYEPISRSVSPAEQRMASTALRNAAYFAVPLSLLDAEFVPPDVISTVVNAEVGLIAASRAVTVSSLLNLPSIPDDQKQRTDYRQFSPPMRYARDGDLVRYYQALTWHRMIGFRPAQREETRSAALMAYTLRADPAARILWERIQAVLSFFQGQDASLSPAQYGDLLAGILDEGDGIASMANQPRMDAFVAAIEALPLPDNPIWELWTKDGLPKRQWRFLSPPFYLHSYIFQQTTGQHVSNAETQRVLPSLVDLAVALGSLESYRVATEQGETRYGNYLDQLDEVRSDLSTLQLSHWTAHLDTGWLHTYRAMTADKTPSYPEWMRTALWQRKELQAMFAGWTLLRHDDAAGPRSMPVAERLPEGVPAPPWGYVEPQPETYTRLAALTAMVIEGLESRMMLTDADRTSLLELEAWIGFLRDVSRRELTGQALTAEEYQRLGLTASLLQLPTRTSENASAIVQIAASEAEQLVEATGRIDTIYVVIERERTQYLARGGVYSHYEFPRPVEETLTDPVWREVLDAGDVPERPVWAQGFVIE